ncbi:hypothetical protein FQR65_LT10043 [Abscondita terminalis]|nr:hypothetical protein FQR65_LT10043 [Abscondita terminalis]
MASLEIRSCVANAENQGRRSSILSQWELGLWNHVCMAPHDEFRWWTNISLKKDDTDNLILDIVNTKTIFGLTNPFDNDGVLENQISMEDTMEESGIESIMMENDPSVSETFNIMRIPADQIDVVMDQPNSSKAAMNLNDSVTDKSLNWTQTFRKVCSRRRPSEIRPLSFSTFAEKYEILLDQKIELANGLQKEHEIRMTLLKLYVALKNKQLIISVFQATDMNLLESIEMML